MEDLASILKKASEALEFHQRMMTSQDQLSHINQLSLVIKQERKKQKITQDTLSRLSGVSLGTIIAIESGKTTPSLCNVQKVLQVLGKELWVK